MPVQMPFGSFSESGMKLLFSGTYDSIRPSSAAAPGPRLGPPYHTSNEGSPFSACIRANASPDDIRTIEVSIPVSASKAWTATWHQSSCIPHKTVKGPLTSGALGSSSAASSGSAVASSGTSADGAVAMSLEPQDAKIRPTITKSAIKK